MTASTLQESKGTNRQIREEIEIRALMDRMHKAHHEKNAAAIVAPYSPGAAVYNLAPPLMHQGRDRQEVQDWLDTWATPIEITPQNFEIRVSGNSAFAHGFLHMRGTKRGATEPVSFWMRETLCFERLNNEWRIVHEHASVPFYMDGTNRPAFDLKP